MSIDKYRVCSTGGNKRQKSVVRVYLAGDKPTLIAEQFVNVHNPLEYIRERNGKHRKQLEAQCKDAGMTQEEFNSIVLAK